MKSIPALDQNDFDSTAGTPPRRALNRRGPAPLALEPRVMFDGATADAAVAAAKAAVADIPAERAVDHAPAEADSHVAAAVLPPEAQRHEVVFIEDNVPDYQKLAAAVTPGVEVVVLDHTKDGLQQMIAALDGRAPVDAIHLVTHGATGQVDLGSERLSVDNLDAHAAQLATLGTHLAADGDILIYGCDVGQGDSGNGFVARMAQLTGADVAASTDITGSKAFGGNWTLEAQAGRVEAQAIEFDRAGWTGELETTVFDAEQRQLTFNGGVLVSRVGGMSDTSNPGTKTGDVVRFTNVITIGGQQINAEITTTLDHSSITSYDYTDANSTASEIASFQPQMKVGQAGGGATFTVNFFTISGAAATLQNVVVNSYDIDGVNSSSSDRQYQEFRGFAYYQTGSELKTQVQSDGSVRFVYDPASGTPKNNTTDTRDNNYRVQVFYDSMSSFQIRTGAIAAASGTFNGTAYFYLDFELHEWGTTKIASPAPKLSYTDTTLVETDANNGAVMSTTITLSGTNAGGSAATFAGTNGQDLDVSFSNLPAGLTAHVTRNSATTATLSFSGNALAHLDANDIANFGVTFNNGAFTSGVASAVTGASRADISIDFNNPPPDAIAPVVQAGQAFGYAENRGAAAGAIGTVAASDNTGVAGFRFANADGSGGSATSADGWFTVDSSGRISMTSAGRAAAANDYESGTHSFTYAVQAGDAAGNWSDRTDVTLNLANVDELAPAFTSGASANPMENQPVLYNAQANDNVDFTNHNVTYGLKPGVGDVAALSIDTHTGVVSLASGNLDFETKSSYSFTVTARDDSGNQSERAVTVAVGDIDEVAPTVTISADPGVIKAGATRTLTFDFSEDVGTSFSADDVSLDSGSIGPLTQVSATRYTAVYTPGENVTSASVQVRVGAGRVSDLADNPNSAPASLALAVDTAAPRITGPLGATGASSALSVPEGTTALHTFSASESVSWSLAGGEDAARFTISADGALSFTSAPDYEAPQDGATDGSNTYLVQVRAVDAAGNATTQSVKVSVTNVNELPVAAPDSIVTAEDTAWHGQLPSASDPDHDTVTYARASSPAHGTVSIEADGSYTYQPAADYHGSDSFSYTVSDGNGGSNTYTVSVTVTPVNDAPVGAGASITTAEDSPKTGTLPQAHDVDGDAVTYDKAGDPAHGTVTIGTDGSYTYAPGADYHGADSFSYTVSDGHGGSNTYTVEVTVTPVNDAPVAGNVAIATAEDTVKTGTLPQAHDVDGDAVTYAKAGDPAHGTVTIGTDGSYTYTPAADYNGPDSFSYTVKDGQGGSSTYTVEVSVGAVNDAPVAANAAITTAEDTAKSGTLPQAHDVEGDAVTYAKAGDPAHGTVVITEGGGYTYAPAADYNGADSFSYTVSDGHGGSNTYTVEVTVTPVNDAPVAGNATIATLEDTPKSGTLPQAHDVDGDAVTYVKAGDPAHGTVTIGTDGGYTYTPAADYNGPDSFSYTVKDGQGGSSTYTVEVTVGAVNDAPVAANATITTAEDTAKSGTLPQAHDAEGDTVTYAKAGDPAHGTVTIGTDGGYTYTPAADYNGADSFSYTVKDGQGGSSTYTVEVSVGAVNDAPVAANTAITTAEDTAKSGTLPQAHDVDGDAVTYAKALEPAHGTLVVTAGGGYTYTPDADYTGADRFSYTIKDGQGGSNTYTVEVTVTPVNDAPVAANAAIETLEDTVKSGLLPAAHDIDGDAVTYAKALEPAHGTVTVTADGLYAYTPDADYHGPDSFSYTVSDGQGGSNTYTVDVTVTPVNDAPTASATHIDTPEDTAKTGTLPQAHDVDGDGVTYAKAADPAHGTVVVTAGGGYTYTPDADYHGTDSFSYTVKDGQGGSSTYTVDVSVVPVNDAPVAANAAIETPEDTAKTGTLPQAHDIDGDTVTYAKAGDPAHGTVRIERDGSYLYTPAADYHGADRFSYSVSDGHGGSNTYVVDVTVTPVNDAPTASGTRIETPEDTVKTGTLPQGRDVDGDPFTYAKAGDPAHGSVVITADGGYTYTPDADYHGADSFSYTIKDGQGGSNTYTVDVSVGAVNDAPVAANAAIATLEDTVKAGTLPQAHDVDGDTVTYAKAGDPAHGTLSVNADGSYVYTPAADYNGADRFSYTVSDGQGGSNTYTVDVTVTPVNDAPVAHGGASGKGTVGEPMDPVTVPAFTDVDGPATTYTALQADGSPLPSWLGFDPATRSFTGTPPQGSVGTLTIVVSGSDGSLGAKATVTIEVANPALPGQSPAITLMTKDTGASPTDFVTGDGSGGRTVSGTLGAALGHNEVVQVSFDGGTTWNTAVVDGGTWRAVDNGAHAGNWTIETRVTNVAAGLSGPVTAREVVLDTTPPAAPTVDSITTTSTTPVLSGAATVGAGEVLRVTVNGATYEVPAQDGRWTLDLASAKPVSGSAVPLTVGQNYDVTATVTDLAGNVRDGANQGLVSVSPPVLAPEAPPAVVQATVPVLPATPAPAPVAEPTPVPMATDSRVRNDAAPGSLASGDSQQFGYGQGIRSTETAALDLRGAALSDIYTRTEGFRTVVAKAEEPALVLFQGVPDQFTEAGTHLSLTVPADAFAHTQPNATVRLVAVLQDGRPLPTWVQFNGQTGQFIGEVPKGLQGELRIKLVARDLGGREASALFRINVGQQRMMSLDTKAAPSGKPGLSTQLRAGRAGR